MALFGHGAMSELSPLSGQSGLCVLVASISPFDPTRTSAAATGSSRIIFESPVAARSGVIRVIVAYGSCTHFQARAT